MYVILYVRLDLHMCAVYVHVQDVDMYMGVLACAYEHTYVCGVSVCMCEMYTCVFVYVCDYMWT